MVEVLIYRKYSVTSTKNIIYTKESLKIETITSSFKIIIEQDIYSQMLAFNIIRAFVNDAQKQIDQTKYKNEMKINMNMAIVFVKKTLILIIIEEDRNKQDEMFELLMNKIPKYIVPIKKIGIILETKIKETSIP